MSHLPSPTTRCAAALLALLLGACGKPDDRTAGERVAATFASLKHGTEAMRESANRNFKVARQAGDETAVAVGASAGDAGLASAVTRELARDPQLEPACIAVDVRHGRVALRGTAPDTETAVHARRVALAVQGVRGVDNFLAVVPTP